MSDEQLLDAAVLKYIMSNSGKVDSVDVVSHFGLRCDVTLFAINRLEEAGRIQKRELFANQSRLYFIK